MMTKNQNIIRAKAGLLEPAKQLWEREPGVQDDGLHRTQGESGTDG